MRQITKKMVSVFLQQDEVAIKSGDDQVTCVDGEKALHLHGHVIALQKKGKVEISNRGYETNVTKDRLNGVLELMGKSKYKIYRKNFVWYWKNGKEFPFNEMTKVN